MSKIWAELVNCGSNTQKRKDAVRHCFDEIRCFVQKFQFDLPDYYLALVRAVLTLEGIALTADCQFDIFQAIFPVALRALTSGDESPGVGSIAKVLVPALVQRCRRRRSQQEHLAGLAACTTVASVTAS